MSSIIASKKYKSGDIIMRSKPLVQVIVDQMKSLLCDNCLNYNSSLMSCSLCEQMFYCNQFCQQNDWSYHRLECHLFKTNPNLTSSTIIIIRLWLMLTTDKSLSTKEFCLPSGQKVCLNDIKININEDINSVIDSTNQTKDLNNFSIKELAVFQFKLLVEKFVEFKLEPDLKLLWLLFVRVWSNVLRIDVIDSDSDHNAYGLFIEASFLNHSCEPNAGFVNYGNELQVRAMKTIKPNEEITISYIDLAQSKSCRALSLKSHFIECKCFKCRLNSDSNIDYKAFHELNNEFSQLLKFGKENYSQELCSIASKLFPLYQSIYVNYNPDLSLFLVKYLKVLLTNVMLNNEQNINQNFIDFVIKNVKKTHGIDHKLFRKIPLINDITLLDLESNSTEVIKKLKSKPTSKIKTFIFRALVLLVILLIIFEYLF